MNLRLLRWPLSVVVLAVALVAVFFIGRHTAPAHNGTWSQGYSIGYDEGMSIGRALQVGASLPADTKDVATKAFQSGYQAGLTDSFGSYDGGWNIGQPYVIVMQKGVGDAPYRIDSRELLEAGKAYELCQGGKAVCTK